MKNLTHKDLYEFVYRADTIQKTTIAERWLKSHPKLTSKSILDDLLSILDNTAKRLFNEALRAYENSIFIQDRDGNNYLTDTISGEVILTT